MGCVVLVHFFAHLQRKRKAQKFGLTFNSNIVDKAIIVVKAFDSIVADKAVIAGNVFDNAKRRS